ncbi:folate family ECF transporter S component [Thermophilibacter sp.]
MKRNQNGIFSTRNLILMAALIAMQIILARFLSIQVSDILRISFESVPVILAGMWLGPLSGAIVALVADILGTIIHGYGVWFPPIALGPILVGVISGLSTKYVFRSDLSSTRESWKVVATVLVAGIVNSFLIGTVTTTMYSIIVMGNTNAFSVLLWSNFLGRLASKPVTILVNAVLVAVVNRAVYRPVIRPIVHRA